MTGRGFPAPLLCFNHNKWHGGRQNDSACVTQNGFRGAPARRKRTLD
jgi:hypothetical protein